MSEPAKDEDALIKFIGQIIFYFGGEEEFFMENAEAALTIIRAAGWAVVPVEPTDEMFEAGHEEVLGGSGVIATYRAMLAAAPGVKP
jgi:hypothetical protein